MEHFELGGGGGGAAEEGGEILDGVGAAVGCGEEAAGFEGGFEAGEEGVEIGFGCGLDLGGGRRKWSGFAGTADFPGYYEDGLGEIEGGEFWIGGKVDEAVGAGEGGVVEAGALGSEDEGGGFWRSQDFWDGVGDIEPGDLAGAGAGGGGEDAGAIGGGGGEGGEGFGGFEDAVGIGGGGKGGRARLLGPTTGGGDEAEAVEPAIEHRTGSHADICIELGAYEDDDGGG